MERTWWNSLILQSQLTRIHRATRYGVETWCHFQVTIGRVVMGPPPWPLSPLVLLPVSPVVWGPVSPVLSWPETFSCPVAEFELEVSPWSPPCSAAPASSLAGLGPQDTISSKDRNRANLQVAAMLDEERFTDSWATVIEAVDSSAQAVGKSLTHLPSLLLPSQVSFAPSLYSYIRPHLYLASERWLCPQPGIQLLTEGEAQPILMLVCRLPLCTQPSKFGHFTQLEIWCSCPFFIGCERFSPIILLVWNEPQNDFFKWHRW